MTRSRRGLAALIDRAVDVNPRQHGMFVAGSGQVVVGPDAFTDILPGVVLVMNPNDRNEISATLKGLGVSVDIHNV